jgi:hypothetical protein
MNSRWWRRRKSHGKECNKGTNAQLNGAQNERQASAVLVDVGTGRDKMMQGEGGTGGLQYKGKVGGSFLQPWYLLLLGHISALRQELTTRVHD